MSTIGRLFRVTTFGESHGKSVGVTIDSPLPNMKLDMNKVQHQLRRRRPGQSGISTPRQESDELIVLSGLEDGVTLGTPLTIIVDNLDQRKGDYAVPYPDPAYIPRPSHADYTYLLKYGTHASSGGGRSSARETIGRVIAGGVADQILETYGVEVVAFVEQVGDIRLDSVPRDLTRVMVDGSVTRCPDKDKALMMGELIFELKEKGDSVGGVVGCVVRNCPQGLGEPVFDKLQATLAHAVMSIPAAKGFEIGSGFGAAELRGSQHNDPWARDISGKVTTVTNNSGGIVGGISTGMDIVIRTAFKPPATISMDQQTTDISGNTVTLSHGGRHDPCVVPRAVPIVEAMVSITIADALLQQTARVGCTRRSQLQLLT